MNHPFHNHPLRLVAEPPTRCDFCSLNSDPTIGNWSAQCQQCSATFCIDCLAWPCTADHWLPARLNEQETKFKRKLEGVE